MNVLEFFRSAHDDNRVRRKSLRRHLGRDFLLYAANRALWPAERLLAALYRRESLPVVFIVGAPRSGTTLLYQLMARHLDVGYVTNFMARFWLAPVTGAYVGRRLRDRRLRGHRGTIPLDSDYGRTRGPASPHEFTWFWKARMGLGQSDALEPAELEAVNRRRLRGELLALAGVFGRPFVWKSVNFADYHIGWLHALLPDARFLRIRRDPLDVACSILRARRSQYGDPRKWWSVRPRDVDDWRERPWAEQIAHQVHDVEAAVDRQVGVLPPRASLELDYEGLTADPVAALRELATFLEVDVHAETDLEALRLEARGGDPAPEDRAVLERAWARYVAGHLADASGR